MVSAKADKGARSKGMAEGQGGRSARLKRNVGGPAVAKEGLMDFGLLLSFRNPPPGRVPFTEIYRKHFDIAALAEDLGYGTIWLTEHHFIDDGYAPSLLPIAAAIAARTRRIRIGTFVILLPLHNALRIAEDAATVDIISNGRFDLGVGQGYRIPEFVGFDIPRRERGPRLEEGAEVIRRVWTRRTSPRRPLQ